MLNLFSNSNKPLFAEREIYKNREFLIVLSKFIDHKINSSKVYFRCKNGSILIDEVSKHIASLIFSDSDCKLFTEFKKQISKFGIKQKEQKVFKVLLGQKLLLLLSKLKFECDEISKVVMTSKKIKRIKHYKKQILFSAQIYSVVKFNQNSTKLLNGQGNSKLQIQNFFIELFEIERKIKIILLYLTHIFS